MSEKIYIDTEGVTVRVDSEENISTATNLLLHVRKPDGTEVEWSGTLDGTDFIEYVTIAGDLDQAGFYRLQSSFIMDGWDGRNSTAEFAVYPNFG